MEQTAERVALPFTFYLKQEGDQWAALTPEISVSSCGNTLETARQALKDAVETYVFYMIRKGRMREISRPLAADELADFLADPPGAYEVEEHVLFVSVGQTDVHAETPISDAYFVQSMLPAHAAHTLAGK